MDLKNVAIVDLKDRDELKEKAEKFDSLTEYEYLIRKTIEEPVVVHDGFGNSYERNELVSCEIFSSNTEEVVDLLNKEVEKYRQKALKHQGEHSVLYRDTSLRIKKLKGKITALWVWLIIVSLVATGIMIWI
jgi:RNA-binding protein YhbY